MSNLIITPPISDKATLTPGSEVATLPATNLQDDRLHKRWRSPDLDLMDSQFMFNLVSLDPQTRGVFSGAGGRWDSTWMVFQPGDVSINAEVGRGVGASVYERVLPNAILAATNIAGAATDIDDDPYSLDGNQLSGGTAGLSTSVTIGFATPASAPADGDRNQVFRAVVNSSDTGAGSTIEVELELIDEDVGALGVSETFTIPTDGTNRIIQLAWDADLLTIGSGEDAALTISCPSATFDIEAVDWVAASADLNWTPIFQTGDLEGRGVNEAFPYQGPVPNAGPIVVRVPGAFNGNGSAHTYLRDLYRGLPEHTYGHDYGTWLQARRLFVGRDILCDYYGGSSLDAVDPSDMIAGPSGALFFDSRPGYRQARFDLTPTAGAQALDQLLYSQDMRRGRVKPVGMRVQPTQDVARQHLLTMYGHIEPSTTSLGTPTINDRHNRTILFREAVA